VAHAVIDALGFVLVIDICCSQLNGEEEVQKTLRGHDNNNSKLVTMPKALMDDLMEKVQA